MLPSSNGDGYEIACVAKSSVRIRMAFLRNVYFVLAIQQFFIATVSFALFITPGVRPFVQYYSLTIWLTMMLLLLSAFFLRQVVHHWRRWCHLMFVVFTIVLAVACSVVAAYFDTQLVHVVCTINGCIFLTYTIYCMQTRWSLRLLWSVIVIVCIATLISYFLQIFKLFSTIDYLLHILISSTFCLYSQWNIDYFTHFLNYREMTLACVNVFGAFPKFS
ncbi:hypothetical protein KIN20_026945 [Parelaphostrongylus tenuis]|uniref:Uncharacterized protein n=1 Tax=Parelaphostrongylus tenuis TaxID=148309 RepID=A0AAD5QYY4_PARTN|nr:hypothetical protein KIN20_026945 [Parelaphostrongylus tenuis]